MLSLFKRVIALLVAFIMSAIFFAVPPASAETGVTVVPEYSCAYGLRIYTTMGSRPTLVRMQGYDPGKQDWTYEGTGNPGDVWGNETGIYFKAWIAIQTSDTTDADGTPVWTDWGVFTYDPQNTVCPLISPATISKWGKMKASPHRTYALVRATSWLTKFGWSKCSGSIRWEELGIRGSLTERPWYQVLAPKAPGTYCLYYKNMDWAGDGTKPVLMGRKTIRY